MPGTNVAGQLLQVALKGRRHGPGHDQVELLATEPQRAQRIHGGHRPFVVGHRIQVGNDRPIQVVLGAKAVGAAAQDTLRHNARPGDRDVFRCNAAVDVVLPLGGRHGDETIAVEGDVDLVAHRVEAAGRILTGPGTGTQVGEGTEHKRDLAALCKVECGLAQRLEDNVEGGDQVELLDALRKPSTQRWQPGDTVARLCSVPGGMAVRLESPQSSRREMG